MLLFEILVKNIVETVYLKNVFLPNKIYCEMCLVLFVKVYFESYHLFVDASSKHSTIALRLSKFSGMKMCYFLN